MWTLFAFSGSPSNWLREKKKEVAPGLGRIKSITLGIERRREELESATITRTITKKKWSPH